LARRKSGVADALGPETMRTFGDRTTVAVGGFVRLAERGTASGSAASVSTASRASGRFNRPHYYRRAIRGDF
jgi:hypothetical protein